MRAMNDAIMHKMGLLSLQHYFAMLIIHTQPKNPQQLFDDYFDDLYPPLPCDSDEPTLTEQERKDRLMKNLEYFFNCMNKSTR